MTRELTQNGAANSIANLAIEVNELCNKKKLPMAKKVFTDMLALVSGREDGFLCLSVHRRIEETAKELEDNEKPLLKLMHSIASETSSVQRWKLVIASQQYLSPDNFKLILKMDAVKSIKKRIKDEIGYPAGEPVYGNAISKKMSIKKRQPNKLPEMRTYASQLN